ncbi:redoxin domain-containing protein [Pedobacter frigiditerrae]|uniref:Redoxin domain-containing protein n=1 Tax=Pedobacter frigiditerrae TaxID=2530452 RepID=A0A4R0MY44_9SPHI|nr:redoxin domain-containing protein [Pedobacter frigiditerrae]TCC92180.1 redoxin domain-containing protein [Pedobacter frigiditerrae]
MKRIILFMMAFIAFQSAIAQINPFNAKDSVQISGKVVGYDSSQTDHFLSFSTYDLFGRSTSKAIQIEDNGDFLIKLYQSFEGDIQLNYKGAYINVYTKPNNILQLEIYDSKVKQEIHYENAFVAKGELASINNLILKFQTAYDKYPFKSEFDMGDKKQTDSAFAASVVIKLNEQLAFLSAFVEDNQVADQKFINWQRSRFQYEAGQSILFFPFAGKYNKEITQKQLLQLINSIPINNDNALNCSSYYAFLSSLTGAQQIMININPMYDAIKAMNGKNTMGICLDEIDKFATGIARELQYFGSFLRRAGSGSDPMPYLARFNEVIDNPFLKQQIRTVQAPMHKAFNEFDIVARLKALKVKPVLKERLINIFSQYKGMSLYIDFWGDWCGPCMSELPTYPKLIAALAGKQIKFLFLSTFTTVESMLAVKKKFKIDGDFINLSKDEVNIVNNVFEFHSYPSHFLVNDKGAVVSRMSKTTLSTVNEKAEEIATLLKK